MAVENRGGRRPTAPQYNPANVNGRGGNGQSGMNTDYSAFTYGQNKAINEQRAAAPIKAKPATGGANMLMARGPAPVPLNAETQNPDETIFSGSSMPGGLDPSDLNLPAQPVGDPDLDSVIALYPVMRYWANQPDTPNATKEYVRYLGTLISKGPNRPV